MPHTVARTAEAQRQLFRPERISVLFVGESAPAGGTFFYFANSVLYRGLHQALFEKLGMPSDFLSAFSKAGYYLDDLVLIPANWERPADRRRLHRQYILSLTDRLKEYQPAAIVSLLKSIGKAVEQARELSGLRVPHYIVSFPGNGRQVDFHREMASVAPALPVQAALHRSPEV